MQSHNSSCQCMVQYNPVKMLYKRNKKINKKKMNFLSLDPLEANFILFKTKMRLSMSHTVIYGLFLSNGNRCDNRLKKRKQSWRDFFIRLKVRNPFHILTNYFLPVFISPSSDFLPSQPCLHHCHVSNF